MAKKNKRTQPPKSSPMNPVLIKIREGIQRHIQPSYKRQFEQLVIEGEAILFNEKSHQNMQLVNDPASRNDPVKTISIGVCGLMEILYTQHHRQIDMSALVMAGYILMTDAIDFAQRGLNIPISTQQIADITKNAINLFFQANHITPQQMAGAIQKGAQEISDYQAHRDYMKSKMAEVR